MECDRQIEVAARRQDAVIDEELAEGGDVDVASGAPTTSAAEADTRRNHGGGDGAISGSRRSGDVRQTDASRSVQHYAGRISKGGRAHYVAADGHDICDGGRLHNSRALVVIPARYGSHHHVQARSMARVRA